MKFIVVIFLTIASFEAGCSWRTDISKPVAAPAAQMPQVTPSTPQPSIIPSPGVPNLQAQLLDDRYRTTSSPIGTFDFKNFTYQLPRGWQNPDGSTDFTLRNGKVSPFE